MNISTFALENKSSHRRSTFCLRGREKGGEKWKVENGKGKTENGKVFLTTRFDGLNTNFQS